MKSLGRFSITAAQSMDFARASGDFNPLHLDPVAARRTRFGHTLIHGVCGTLKCLDLLLRDRSDACELTALKVKYNKPATQGQHLECFEQPMDGMTRLELFADGIRCQIIDLAFANNISSLAQSDCRLPEPREGSPSPVELTIEGAEGLSGAVELCWDASLMNTLFPSASRYMPARQLAAILASTRIVGMECPGLHSVFAKLDLRFATADPGAANSSDPELAYRVQSTDPRIERIEMDLSSTEVSGTVEAFFRPAPVQQAGFKQIAGLVSSGEFSQQRALVIGGSRGLGEVITKVLAAGGANIMMTYAAGADDAARVSSEIAQHGRAPVITQYNVLENAMSQTMTDFCAAVTNIYYLASPTITKSDSKKWDRQLFTRYCDFYIDGLSTLLQQAMQNRDGNRALQVFIPSSIFLEEHSKGFDEYIAAKSAAEAFVSCFEKNHRNVTVTAPRLPRLFTDQTSSVKNTDEQETLDVIIQQLRLASDSGERKR